MPKSPHSSPFEPYQKKGTLKRAEFRLMHAIKHEESIEKLTQAAESVRKAQLCLIESKQKLLPYYFSDPLLEHRRQNLENAEQFWSNRPIEEIISQYKKANAT